MTSIHWASAGRTMVQDLFHLADRIGGGVRILPGRRIESRA
jgi:hypothetical protein